jgi:hypothetical protein
MWLKEYAHENLSFVVEIKGSHGNGTQRAYFHGELEGVQGWTGRLFAAGEVTVPFVPLTQCDFEKLQVPIQYLVPVPPQAEGGLAMPLDGKFKGQVLKVIEADASSCTLVDPASGIVVDILPAHVVRIFNAETGMSLILKTIVPLILTRVY